MGSGLSCRGFALILILLSHVFALNCPPLQGECEFDTDGVHYFSGVSASGSQAVVEGAFTLPSDYSTVMIIQMQAGKYNSSNSQFGGSGGPFTSAGNGYTSLEGAGQYDFSFVSNATLNGTQTILELVLPLSRNFSSVGAARFQVVSFLMCENMTVIGYSSGRVGGVLPIISKNIHFNVDISMDGTGFRGGSANVTNVTTAGNGLFGMRYNATDGQAFKGEGFLGSPQFPPERGTCTNQEDCGRGAPGNAGGGGYSIVGGGGGGGNGGEGGHGQRGRLNYGLPGALVLIQSDALIFGGYKLPSNRGDLLFFGALASLWPS